MHFKIDDAKPKNEFVSKVFAVSVFSKLIHVFYLQCFLS